MIQKKRKFIYFDHSSTTPLDEGVLQVMLPLLKKQRFNPSAVYGGGQSSANHIALARKSIAKKLKIDPKEVFFTSCASESNNLVLKGLAQANKSSSKNIIIIGPTEHSSVIKTAQFLADNFSYKLIILPCDKTGLVSLSKFKELLSQIYQQILLVSVGFASSEIGTRQLIEDMADLCMARGVFFHLDATQAVDFFDLSPKDWGVSAMTLSSHKIYGPSGVGMIYLSNSAKLSPIRHGGGQEKSLVAGTENTVAIVGFAEALRISHQLKEANRIAELTEHLRERLIAKCPKIIFTGHISFRLPFHVSIITPGLKSQQLLIKLDLLNIAASAGSACGLGQVSGDEDLFRLGYNESEISSALRLTLGRSNDLSDVEEFIDRFSYIYKHDIS
ncbi:MAG: cysteine desulfurase [SAR324 cluster bacterium]|nr:cysteine desulfurase [SAR324 cluster bacterium]